MSEKVLMILCDGMRPDAVEQTAHPFFDELKAHSAYTMAARTVMPSVTLPCHMSLFHSVDPSRHGIMTNTYVPQVRPVRGICEVLRAAGKKCGMFYSFEELKDLTRPDSMMTTCYISGHLYTYEKADEKNTARAVEFINESTPDFVFLYLCMPDDMGHGHGWMSGEYMYSVKHCWDCIETAVKGIPDDYTVIVTADHGGHERFHGTDMPQDMTIPLMIYKKDRESEPLRADADIMDIAPTITALLGVAPDTDWEGKSLL